jgi:hypothetical protein
MNQPVPNVSDADVARVVMREYPATEVPAVIAALEAYGKSSWHRDVARVRLAILKLTGGNRKKLDEAIVMADRDYRDVLACAEYPKYFDVIAPTEKDDAKKKSAIDADWQQYRSWFERK